MDYGSVTGKVFRYLYTLRHLKPEQVLFQLYYRFRRAVRPVSYDAEVSVASAVETVGLRLAEFIAKPCTFQQGQYTFLNLSLAFPDDAVDWECMQYGKLWLYNLHYFDYLLQPDLEKEIGVGLIRQYVAALPSMQVGIEPYPVSLRGINWIKFLSLYGISYKDIDRLLYSQYHILSRTLEFHLLGNHLLENAFSLLFGAVYFGEYSWFDKSRKLLLRELQEQVLVDGAHFELSPMYHQILLDRLLDCVNLLLHNQRFSEQEKLLGFMREKAVSMLGWLQTMTLADGSIPHLNDATDGIAPSSEELFSYAQRLGLSVPESVLLSESGYRRYDRAAYTCIADVGKIGPDYIPGHAHADTLNFVLQVHGKPFLVDTGISTYEKNSLRDEERGTAAHNTVLVNSINSSDVWGGFRVGKRARVRVLEDDGDRLTASHDGYRALGVVHQRDWRFTDSDIVIADEVSGQPESAVACLHFEYGIQVEQRASGVVADGISVEFEGAEGIVLEPYQQAQGFNKRREAVCVKVRFSDKLLTSILL
ncbi:MAG: heparinase II/III family protein [Chlorobium sp.]|uniref:alginate lyase family protein n=1 Tax=Chlorobium sp. TaxID=1095 RepID=UPI002F3EB5E5